MRCAATGRPRRDPVARVGPGVSVIMIRPARALFLPANRVIRGLGMVADPRLGAVSVVGLPPQLSSFRTHRVLHPASLG